MTIYYVRKGGNDANDGLSAALAHAWLTIDQAANTVAAGDTVYIGAGVYRETVTMDTPGAAGSQISFEGDFDGAQTGDAGLVIISAYNDEYDQATSRACCLDMAQREFIVWRNVGFMGGSGYDIVTSAGAGHLAFEGVSFECCQFYGSCGIAGYAVHLVCNNGATPATTGFSFTNCVFVGALLKVDVNNNVTAHYNLKATIRGCLWFGVPYIANTGCVWILVATGTNAFSVGGISIDYCGMIGGNTSVYMIVAKNTTNPSYFRNSWCIGQANDVHLTSGTFGAWVLESISFAGVYTQSWVNAGAVSLVGPYTRQPVLLGGLSDQLHRRAYGWSPWQPFEQIDWPAIRPLRFGSNQGLESSLPATDIFNDPISMQPSGLFYAYANASDAAVTDPGAKWSSDAYAFNGGTDDAAACSVAGSNAANFLMAEGTSAPPGNTSVITQVRMRIRGYVNNAAATLEVHCYADALAEDLATFTMSNTALGWSPWGLVTAPAGGWTWDKLAALEFKAWKQGPPSAYIVYLAYIQLEVTCGVEGGIGPVTPRNRPAQETATPHSGANAMHFTGAGWHDLLIPVNAVATTVTVYGRIDGNYGGANKPQMIAMNIPGQADQTATMTAAANTWQQLTVNFTPSAQGVCRVRLKSRDTGPNGLCIFDDLRRA